MNDVAHGALVEPSPDVADLEFAIRVLDGRRPSSSEQLQAIVLEAFPAELRAELHDARIKAHVFDWVAGGDHLLGRIATVAPPATRALLQHVGGVIEMRMGVYHLERLTSVVATYDQFLANHAAVRPARIRVDIQTPTLLGIGKGRGIPLPVPWLLLSEPAACWREYAGDAAAALPPDLGDWIRDHVSLAQAEVKTVPFTVERRSLPGFVGSFVLTVDQAHARDPEWNWTHLLFDYAHFTGVGKRRARGAGRLAVVRDHRSSAANRAA